MALGRFPALVQSFPERFREVRASLEPQTTGFVHQRHGSPEQLSHPEATGELDPLPYLDSSFW